MKHMIKIFFVVAMLLSGRLYAVPEVTSISLGTSVASTHVVAVATPNMRPEEYVAASTESSIFVLPGQTYGDATTSAPPDYFPGPTYSSANSPLLGTTSGYGALLMQFMVSAADLGGIGYNFPTNSNTSVLSGASGPINSDNLSLTAAGVAAGTSVTVTVDMQNELPHLVAVMGGSYPTISFDNTGTGLLTISATTTGAFTNKAGQDFISGFGFFVVTDDVAATAPDALGMIVQSDHWIGDMFPLLPGLDSNAVTGGGTLSASTARSGLTIAGPCSETRSASFFIPTNSLAALYGSAVTEADIAGFFNDTEQAAAVSPDVSNLNGVGGSKVVFDYNIFTDPVDISIGVSGSTAGAALFSCSIASPGPGGTGGGILYQEVIFFLFAGLMLFIRKITAGTDWPEVSA